MYFCFNEALFFAKFLSEIQFCSKDFLAKEQINKKTENKKKRANQNMKGDRERNRRIIIESLYIPMKCINFLCRLAITFMIKS